MIRINILASRKQKVNFSAYIKDYFPILGIAFTCVVMLNVFFILVGAGKGMEVQRLRASWASQEPGYRQIQALKTEVNGLRQKVGVFRENAFPLMQFSRVMDIVASNMPSNVWLTEMSFLDKNLTLKGGAFDIDDQDASISVTAYKDALAGSSLNQYFTGGVEIGGIERSRIKDKSVLRFEMQLKTQQVP